MGSIVSVDAAVTSLSAPPPRYAEAYQNWSSLYSWGPIGLLPVFHTLLKRPSAILARTDVNG